MVSMTRDYQATCTRGTLTQQYIINAKSNEEATQSS